MQVDCWTDSAATVMDLAKAARDALETQGHMLAVIANGRDFETMRYRIGMRFDFWLHRDP